MNILVNDKNFVRQLLGFVVLQPFLDIYRVFVEDRIQIAGISLVELVNILMVAYLVVLFIVKFKTRPKVFVPFIIYGGLFGVYLVLHIWNITNFDASILNGADMQPFPEIYYILRVYLLPLVVFSMFLFVEVKKDQFVKMVFGLSGLISGIIVLTDLFKVSFIAYASTLDKNQFITRNIIEWFTNPDLKDPAYMTSKGWFYMGNQIGVILFMLYPLVIMQALKYKKKRYYSMVVIQGIAMIMVGTKIALFGGIMILVVSLVIAVFFGMLLKQFSFKWKECLLLACITLGLGVLCMHSPGYKMQTGRAESYKESVDEKKRSEDADKLKKQMDMQDGEEIDAKTKKMFADYVEAYPYSFGISIEFVELFDIEENFEFWGNIIFNGNGEQVNFRKFKTDIYEAVLDKNNSTYDKWLGIGYVSNFPYMERDFQGQNVWFGYIGTILLIGPYYLLGLYVVCYILKRWKTHIRYENAFFAVSLAGVSGAAIVAGHLFYSIFSITIFGWIVVSFRNFQMQEVSR